jgi:hypothetical protein
MIVSSWDKPLRGSAVSVIKLQRGAADTPPRVDEEEKRKRPWLLSNGPASCVMLVRIFLGMQDANNKLLTASNFQHYYDT